MCKSQIPTLAIWGETDDVIPLAGRDLLTVLNPAARNVVIPGAGHTLAYTHVAEVAQVMDTLHVAKGVAP